MTLYPIRQIHEMGLLLESTVRMRKPTTRPPGEAGAMLALALCEARCSRTRSNLTFGEVIRRIRATHLLQHYEKYANTRLNARPNLEKRAVGELELTSWSCLVASRAQSLQQIHTPLQ